MHAAIIPVIVSGMIDVTIVLATFVASEAKCSWKATYTKGDSMRVAIAMRRWVEVRKAARERTEKAAREGLCTGCMQPKGDGRIVRGQHFSTCYKASLRAIKTGLTTEKELVADGRMLPKATPGRKASNPITLEYAK